MCCQVENHWFLCPPRTSYSIFNIPLESLGPESLFTQESVRQPFSSPPEGLGRLAEGWGSTMDREPPILTISSPVLECGLDPAAGKGKSESDSCPLSSLPSFSFP